PLVFLHYAAIFRLFGRDNLVAVKLVTVVWLALTAAVMAAIRRQMGDSPGAPERVAALFVLASFSGWGEEFLSSNTEVLSNLFVLGAVWCMLEDDLGDRASRLISSGLLAGIACLYRDQAIALIAAYVVTVAARPRDFPRSLRRFAYLGLGFFAP